MSKVEHSTLIKRAHFQSSGGQLRARMSTGFCYSIHLIRHMVNSSLETTSRFDAPGSFYSTAPVELDVLSVWVALKFNS